jgi:hypothetical protein
MIKPVSASLNRLQAPPQTPQAIRAEAKKFESMAIAQFLKPMFETIGHAEAPFGGGVSNSKRFSPFFCKRGRAIWWRVAALVLHRRLKPR